MGKCTSVYHLVRHRGLKTAQLGGSSDTHGVSLSFQLCVKGFLKEFMYLNLLFNRMLILNSCFRDR